MCDVRSSMKKIKIVATESGLRTIEKYNTFRGYYIKGLSRAFFITT